MIIAIEGIDMAGKTTQAKLLQDVLLDYVQGEVSYKHFPSKDSGIGREIYSRLQVDSLADATTMQLLYVADFQQEQGTLTKYQGSDKFLVLDRYVLSNLVYGTANKIDLSWCAGLHRYLIQPDLTIVLDLPVEMALTRRPEGKDRYERDGAFLADVRWKYLGLAEAFGYPVVDASRCVQEVHEEVLDLVVSGCHS